MRFRSLGMVFPTRDSHKGFSTVAKDAGDLTGIEFSRTNSDPPNVPALGRKGVRIAKSTAYRLMDLARNFSRFFARKHGQSKLLAAKLSIQTGKGKDPKLTLSLSNIPQSKLRQALERIAQALPKS